MLALRRAGGLRTHPVRRAGTRTAFKRYASTNAPGVETVPIEPRSPVGKVVKKPRRALRFTLTTLILVAAFYTGSVYGSQYSERYRDFFVTEVPLGENLVQLYEDRTMDKELVKRLSERARQTAGKAEQLQKERSQRVEAYLKQQAEKAKAEAAAAAEKAKEKAKDLKENVVDGAQKAQQKAEATGHDIKDKAKAVGDNIKEAAAHAAEDVKAAGEKVKDAVVSTIPAPKEAPYEKPPVPVDYQRPRQLDASPQPPKVAPAAPYTAPLPLGFEPPPGYVVPKKESASAKPAEAKAAPPPLPLVAPAVQEITASEPVLGQLASTIDSLAKYLNDSPTAVGDKGAREVLNTATLDLRNLGKRLDDVKAEERVRLEQLLQQKTKEYNDNLVHAERELVERLEKQEEGWKSTFDQERKDLIQAYREKLDGELAVQKELIEQRLKEEVVAQGIEMQRKWLREIKERVETERAGRLGKLENLQNDLEKLGKTTLENSSWLDANRDVNKLWTAIRAAWQTALDGKDNTAFFREISALANVAQKSPTVAFSDSGSQDSVIQAAVQSIPDGVAQNGVKTFPTLAAWFSDRLVPKIRKASLLPQNGGFASYLASAGLSTFLFQRVGFVQGDDVISTLSRAEWYLTHRDLESAAREVNQLTGWPKILARDWLVAARKHLEVRQALQIAEAEAGLASLLIL